jgi:Bacterial SH3 domain
MTLMSKLMTGAGLLALSTGYAAAAPAVTANDTNLRAGPSTRSSVIASLPAGATVDLMGCQGIWCRVRVAGTVGWATRASIGGGAVASGPGYRPYGYYTYGPYGTLYHDGYGYDGDGYSGSPTSGYYGAGYDTGYNEPGGSGYYGYRYGDRGYRGNFGSYEGARTFGNERRFRESAPPRGLREEGSFRNERVGTTGGARGPAQTAPGTSGQAQAAPGTRGQAQTAPGARGQAPTAPEIGGNNPMKAEKMAPTTPRAPNERASEIKGNNPMQTGGGGGAAAAPSQPAAAQAGGGARGNAAQAGGGARGNARATTGAGQREPR